MGGGPWRLQKFRMRIHLSLPSAGPVAGEDTLPSSGEPGNALTLLPFFFAFALFGMADLVEPEAYVHLNPMITADCICT